MKIVCEICGNETCQYGDGINQYIDQHIYDHRHPAPMNQEEPNNKTITNYADFVRERAHFERVEAENNK